MAIDPVDKMLFQGNIGAALEEARVRTVADADNLDHHELYIDLLLTSGQPQRAVTEYTGRVRTQPESADAHYLLGRAHVDEALARAAYERALRFDPDHARAHMGVAAVHTSQGRIRDAASAYNTAIELDSSLGEAWVGLVRVLLVAQESEMALDVARRGLVAVPEEGGLALAAANLDPANALVVLETAVKRADSDPRVHTALGEVLLSQGKPVMARTAASRALEIDPADAGATRVVYFADSVASGRLDLPGLKQLLTLRDVLETDPAKAAAGLKALAERYRNEALVFLSLAEAQDRMGQPDEALQSLALCLQRAPDLPDAQATFGLALARAGRHEEAVPWLAKALYARPWDHGLHTQLGRSQRLSGKTSEAVRTLHSAHMARPWDVPTRIAYAEAMQADGDNEGAYALIRDGLREKSDPNLAVAFVLAATAAGHQESAAAFLDQLGLGELATRLRAE